MRIYSVCHIYLIGTTVEELEADEDITISDADSEKVDRVIDSLPISDKGVTAAEAQGEHLSCQSIIVIFMHI